MSNKREYRTKEAVVEAIQYTKDNVNDVATFVGDWHAGNYSSESDFYEIPLDDYEFDFLEVRPFDYVVKGFSEDEWLVLKPQTFEALFSTAEREDEL